MGKADPGLKSRLGRSYISGHSRVPSPGLGPGDSPWPFCPESRPVFVGEAETKEMGKAEVDALRANFV